jgi:hypothetical protein
MTKALHPAENRGYRELYVFARQLVEHWSALAGRLPQDTAKPFEDGARAAQQLLDELAEITPAYGLYGKVAAQGLGRNVAGAMRVRDRFLELNQGARLAVTEIQQVTTLLAYLAAVAESRSDAELAEFCSRWERKLKRIENAARKAVASLGADPDGAIERLDSSTAGKLAYGAAYVGGTIGEWVDRQVATRRKS